MTPPTAWLAPGDVLVGQAAQRHSLVDPQSTFSSVKRFIVRL
jgi:molecular chaperone DnaK (HSP70)